MKQDQSISDEFLNAFVDDQLEPAEKSRAFDLVEHDEALKERVCELRGLKEKVQHAYLHPPQPAHTQKKGRLSGTPYPQALAACLLLVIGSMSGWFAHHWVGYGSDQEIMRSLQTVQRNDIGANSHKLMIHVGTSNQVRLKNALDEAENLLANAMHANQTIQVEIIANSKGLELLRADVSPFAQRISLMQEKYPALSLMACGQTIRNLHAKGVNVHLLPNTGVAPSALGEITLRLKQGWGYIKV
ncbi:MAG: hypothetical protein ABIG70_09910 [Pseudomonadota bacterium]|jgi:intracellular sulfur oxidation DsrE/DsrF family protein